MIAENGSTETTTRPQGSRYRLLAIVVAAAVGGCVASEEASDLIPETFDGRSDQLRPIGSFRALATEDKVGFSALVLRTDGSFYSEFCNGVPSSPECQRGHEPFGQKPQGDRGSAGSGEVGMAWGAYRLLRSPTSGKRFIEFDAGEARGRDLWAYYWDGRVVRIWRDQPELDWASALGVNRLGPTTPICWQVEDCRGQGLSDTNLVCSDEGIGPGQCLVVEVCTSLDGAPGACVGLSDPEVEKYRDLLPRDVCTADQRCVPCINPLTGEDSHVCSPLRG